MTGALGSSTDSRVMSTEAAVTARVELTGTGTCGATPVKSATSSVSRMPSRSVSGSRPLSSSDSR